MLQNWILLSEKHLCNCLPKINDLSENYFKYAFNFKDLVPAATYGDTNFEK